ncbi:hypothetical protein DL768_002638 [Monosporascus sp. mg162]|nr:hypothetical protein DL768_002638 [Monosporascus sp. mg162]
MSYVSSPAFPGAEISLDGPSIPAPAGSVSILDNPPNGNHIAIPVITVCVVLTAIFYVIRFYAKYLAKKINAADYLSAIAFPLFWVYVYYSYRLSWTSGYLVHMWDLRLKDLAAFSYVCFLATLLYLWIIALVKCAILLEWIDIFVPKGNRSYFTRACYATCVAISSSSIIIFIMALVNCTPLAAIWDPLIPSAFCRFDIAPFNLASATTNLVLDLIPLILAQKCLRGKSSAAILRDTILHFERYQLLLFHPGAVFCVRDDLRPLGSVRAFHTEGYAFGEYKETLHVAKPREHWFTSG